MTILCSTPTVNHDPLPWLIEHNGEQQRFPTWFATRNSLAAEYRPRSEYDEPTAHQPNPLLVAARNSHMHLEELDYNLVAYDTFGGYTTWNNRRNQFHALTQATPEQLEHARLVLERLVTKHRATLDIDLRNR
jgi:hypothetical protein